MARTQTLGALCVVGGLIGAVGGLVAAFVTPQVPETIVSYPYHGGTFVATQLLWAVAHLLVAAGLIGVRLGRLAGPRPWAARGTDLAVVGTVALAALELAVVPFRADPLEDPVPTILLSGFGVASVLAGAGMITAGTSGLRAGLARRAVPLWLLIGGAYVAVLLVTLPVGGSTASVSIAGYYLCLTGLGVAIVAQPVTKNRKDLVQARKT